MELTKITRSKSFEMTNGFGLKIWDKIGAEMSINPTDDPKQGYKTMDDLIEEVHKESYKEFSIVADNVPVPEVQVEKPLDKISGYIQVIELTQSVPALERFKPRVEKENNTELTEAYNKQLQILNKK